MTEIMTLRRPLGWKLYRLGQVFEERKEKVSDKDYSPLSVTMNGIVPQLDSAAKTDDGDNRKLVRAGDYVINSRSDRKGSGGLSAYDGSVSLISIVMRLKNIYPQFAHHLLRSQAFQEEFYRWGHGIVADLWTTRFSDMKNIRIYLPCLAQQKLIADFLNRECVRIDQLIEKKRRFVELMSCRFDTEVRLSVTQGLVGADTKPSGVNYLGGVPLHWSVEKVGRRYTIQLGKMLDAAKQTGEHLAPYLRVADVQWDEIRIEDLPAMDFSPADRRKFKLRPGDLIVNEGGSYVGRSAIWNGDLNECYFQKALHRVRPRNPSADTADFFLWVMWFATKAGVFIANGNQTTIDHLTAEAFRRYHFAFPPIEEQRSIASKLRTVRTRDMALSELVVKSIERLRNFKAALITTAVTGQIQVADWAKRGQVDRRLDEIQKAMLA